MITYKGNAFQMAWCLQCHRAPQRYLYKDQKDASLTPRQQVFNLYWKLQEFGVDHLSDREKDILDGEYGGTDKPSEVADGKKLINDCSVCHR
jgi:hypothetical protein